MATEHARARRGGPLSVVVGAMASMILIAGCTSGGAADPPTGGAAATSRAGVAATSAAPETRSATGATGTPDAAPGPAGTPTGPDPVVPPGPSMTLIEPAVVCTVRRPLTDPRSAVPLEAVFPGAASGAISDPDEVVPGPDATDTRRCPGELPTRPDCQSIVPWTGTTDDEFVPASRARRMVAGYLLTMPQLAGNQSPPESSPGTKVVTYRVLDLAPGDPRGLVDYLDLAFRTCARAREGTVAGVSGLTGTVRSEYGAGSAQVVLLTRGQRVVWAQLDGSGWESGQRGEALAVLVARLL